MELLIIGIDGGDERIIRGMDMPFLQSLIENSHSRKLTEDIYSRGWAEILTGLAGPDNGSIYMAPKLDGTHHFTFKFGMNEMVGKDFVTALPQLVEASGRRFGMMNVPTTGPACEVNGFMVAGGGGGMNKIEGIPPELCWPRSLAEKLDGIGYVPDLRLKTSGIESFSKLMDSLDKIVQTRADAFLALVEEFSVDVGFLCFRVTTDIQYLAMSEIESILSMRDMPEVRQEGFSEKLSEVQRRIVEHYRILDGCIRKVFETLRPSGHIITSDHGASRYLHSINFDRFLQEEGLQFSIEQQPLKSLLRKVWRNFLPKSFVKKVKESASSSVIRSVNRFNVKSTKAFGHTYSRGIYINDSERFAGPIRPGKDLDHLVDEIVSKINSDPRSKEIGLEVKPYRRYHMDSRFADILADILIVGPDTNFVTGEGDFISRNMGYGPIEEDLSHVKSDMHSGQKGRHPICFLSRNLEDLIDASDPDNLTFVYHLVARSLKS